MPDDTEKPKPLAQLAAVERYEAVAQSAARSAADLADEADMAVQEFEELFTELATAEEEAKRAEFEAQQMATCAAEASAEAERLQGIAKAAREDGPVVLDVESEGSTQAGGRSALWDIQLAIHCLRPTGKGQCKTHKLHGAIKRAKSRVSHSASALDATRSELEKARAEVARLSGIEAEQAAEKENDASWLATLLEKQKAEEAGRHIFTIPHTPESTKEAWMRALVPLHRRLSSLHLMGLVDFATVGFVRSDSEAWRKFWTVSRPTAAADAAELSGRSPLSPGSPDARPSAGVRSSKPPLLAGLVRCVAPHQVCGCALCANRGADPRRNRARASTGDGGAFVHFAGLSDDSYGDLLGPHAGRSGSVHRENENEMAGELRPSTAANGHRMPLSSRRAANLRRSAQLDQDDQDALGLESRAAQPGEAAEGDPAASVGTRITGVVRVRASIAAAALDLVTANVASALHEARGPASVPERELSQMDGLYDVQWNSAAKDFASTTSSDASSATSPGSTRRSMSPRGGAASPKVKGPAQYRIVTGPWNRALRPKLNSSGGSQPGEPASRPCLFNPHAALLLDVQARLLSTTGKSHSYVSGRSQSEQGLPWFGIGRGEFDFQHDRKELLTTVRRSAPRSPSLLASSAGRSDSPDAQEGAGEEVNVRQSL